MPQPRGGRPTIADVARLAGVSRTTVSHALNDRGAVDPATRARVKQVASEIGYRPNLRAQRLRDGRANSIAVASSMPVAVAGGPSRLGFYMEVAAAAAERALVHGYALVLLPPMQSANAMNVVDVDGAIVVEPDRDDPLIAALVDRRLPYVTLGRHVGAGTEAPHVDLHGGRVVELLLEHLNQQGSRRPALLVGESERHAYVDVRTAYERAAADGGWPPVVVTAPEKGGEQAGYDSCSELLDRHPETDAVCAMVDAFAVGAVRAVRASGRRVPDDVMVVTRYDGIRARTCDPPLTAVDLHLEEAAGAAVELMLGRLAGEDTPLTVSGPEPELVVRQSSRRSQPEHERGA